MRAGEASRTAVLVCQGRAVAHDRLAVGRFADPTAFALLRGAERTPVERARSGVEVRAWGERMEVEMLRGNAEAMTPRTIAIDDAVRAKPNPQVAIVGAGLDGRAWRMPELGSSTVFEIDHPASQRDKRDRIGELPCLAGTLRFVPVDLAAEPLGAALAAAGHDPETPTTWIWEGVVPYLTREQVAVSLAALRERSAAGSRLVVEYHEPHLSAVVGRLAARAMIRLVRRPDPMAGEPRRSAWTAASMAELLSRHGLRVVSDDDLLSLATALPIPVRHRRSLRHGRVAVADW
jgi:methyltransferase (TIGR00027 family)